MDDGYDSLIKNIDTLKHNYRKNNPTLKTDQKKSIYKAYHIVNQNSSKLIYNGNFSAAESRSYSIKVPRVVDPSATASRSSSFAGQNPYGADQPPSLLTQNLKVKESLSALMTTQKKRNRILTPLKKKQQKESLIQHLTHGNDFIIKSSKVGERKKEIELVSAQKGKRVNLKYQIFMGNNGKLVSRVMAEGCPNRAMIWLESQNLHQSHYHFRWAPTSKGINFERLSHNMLQIANHFEFHSEISRKHELFRNVKQYLEKSHTIKPEFLEENLPPLYAIMPLQFHIKISMLNFQQSPLMPSLALTPNEILKQEKHLKQQLKQQMFQFKQIFQLFDEFRYFDGIEFSEPSSPLKKSLKPIQKSINSQIFISPKALAHGYDSIEKTIEPRIKKKKSKIDFQAETLVMLNSQQIVPIDKHVKPFNSAKKDVVSGLTDFILPMSHFARVQKDGKKSKYTEGGKNLWILKPVGLNRGQGIHVVDSIKKCKKLIKQYCFGKEAVLQEKVEQIKCTQFIIQKYIEDPLLIHGRKFDIRVWVLVNHNQDCFFFKEGYIRTSSSPYTTDPAALENEYVHLTNNAIQKNSPNYCEFEDGNQLSFEDFKKYLKNQGKPEDFFDKVILKKMKNYTKISLESIKKRLNPNKKNHCFEIFGYDYILDAEYNTWLIEANTNPCLEESSQILKMLLPRMLNDAFKLTIDLIYKPDKKHPFEQPYSVKNYSDNVNMWEKLCNIGGQQSSTGQMEYTGKSKFISSTKPTEYQINQEFIKNLSPNTNQILQLINPYEIKIISQQ